MSAPTEDPLNISIVEVGKDFYDFGPHYDGFPSSAHHLVERARRLIGQVIYEEIGADLHIRAMVVLVNGKRIIILSNDDYETHIFPLRCLSHGIPIEASGEIVVRTNGVIGIPRRLPFLSLVADQFPGLQKQIPHSPSWSDWDGNIIYAITPQTHGWPWEISQGAPDCLVFLESNLGGLSSAGRISAEDAFERLLGCCIGSWKRESGKLVALHRFSRLAPSWILRSNRSDRDLWHLSKIAQENCASNC